MNGLSRPGSGRTAARPASRAGATAAAPRSARRPSRRRPAAAGSWPGEPAHPPAPGPAGHLQVEAKNRRGTWSAGDAVRVRGRPAALPEHRHGGKRPSPPRRPRVRMAMSGPKPAVGRRPRRPAGGGGTPDGPTPGAARRGQRAAGPHARRRAGVLRGGASAVPDLADQLGDRVLLVRRRRLRVRHARRAGVVQAVHRGRPGRKAVQAGPAGVRLGRRG